jgi:S1-C subfamily serine protease
MRTIIAFALTVVMALSPLRAFAADDDKAFVEKAKNAVALLYSQDQAGGMVMHCTATIFEKTKDGYRFVTAAHCIGNDDVSKERSAKPDNIPFFVTFDESGSNAKKFYPAKVVLVGYQHRGEDFSVLEVVTKEVWPVIPLGDEKKETVPAPFWNVGGPLGLGKVVLEGAIANLDLDRPIVEGDINWQHSMVLQESGVNGGSSGSSLIAKDQHAIVGFLVGTIAGTTITAIPVSRFKAVLAAQAKGKYRWYRPIEELEPPDADAPDAGK